MAQIDERYPVGRFVPPMSFNADVRAGFIKQIESALQGQPCNCAIHHAGIKEGVTKRTRETKSDGGLA